MASPAIVIHDGKHAAKTLAFIRTRFHVEVPDEKTAEILEHLRREIAAPIILRLGAPIDQLKVFLDNDVALPPGVLHSLDTYASSMNIIGFVAVAINRLAPQVLNLLVATYDFGTPRVVIRPVDQADAYQKLGYHSLSVDAIDEKQWSVVYDEYVSLAESEEELEKIIIDVAVSAGFPSMPEAPSNIRTYPINILDGISTIILRTRTETPERMSVLVEAISLYANQHLDEIARRITWVQHQHHRCWWRHSRWCEVWVFNVRNESCSGQGPGYASREPECEYCIDTTDASPGQIGACVHKLFDPDAPHLIRSRDC